jgi:hypothetical protein
VGPVVATDESSHDERLVLVSIFVWRRHGYTGLLVLQKVQGAQSEVELFYSTILESVKCELKCKVMYTLSLDCSVARLRLVVAELAMRGSRTIAK